MGKLTAAQSEFLVTFEKICLMYEFINQVLGKVLNAFYYLILKNTCAKKLIYCFVFIAGCF